MVGCASWCLRVAMVVMHGETVSVEEVTSRCLNLRATLSLLSHDDRSFFLVQTSV